MRSEYASYEEILEELANEYDIRDIERIKARYNDGSSFIGEIYLEDFGWCNFVSDHCKYQQVFKIELVDMGDSYYIENKPYELLDKLNKISNLTGSFILETKNGNTTLVYQFVDIGEDAYGHASAMYNRYCHLLNEFITSRALQYAKGFETL